jgi:hypothetical protein
MPSAGASSGDSPATSYASDKGAVDKKAERTGDVPEEMPEDELAPAAVQLDLSKASLLIQELYAATRETKEQAILHRLAKAKELVASIAIGLRAAYVRNDELAPRFTGRSRGDRSRLRIARVSGASPLQ